MGWKAAAPLDFGFGVRRIRDDGQFWSFYYTSPNTLARATEDRFRGTGVRKGGYLQQSLNLVQERVRAVFGGRWDRHSVNQVAVVSPFTSLALAPRRGTELRLAWGQYAQFPGVSQFYS